MATSNPIGVKALAFDVFGTVVDWRGSIIREGSQWGQTKGLHADWAKLADRWREGYAPTMDKVRKVVLPSWLLPRSPSLSDRVERHSILSIRSQQTRMTGSSCHLASL